MLSYNQRNDPSVKQNSTFLPVFRQKDQLCGQVLLNTEFWLPAFQR